jgi:dihydroorotate dehydrogenase electron transfer subunit
MSDTATSPLSPVREDCQVVSMKEAGGYQRLTVVADAVAERARPGMFVTLRVGGDTSAMLRRRPFWVHRTRPSGVYGGTVEVVFAVRGPATRWLAGLSSAETVDVLGPLGRPFALPREPVVCALVGEGYGAAPLFLLGERLRERECGVHMVLGAVGERGLFGALEARRAALSVTVTTLDGSVGIKGDVVSALPPLLRRHGVDVVYACGSTRMLREVAQVARTAGAWSQVAVEAPMACGIGACLSCVVPVRAKNGTIRPARACVDGPVFAGDTVDWSLT